MTTPAYRFDGIEDRGHYLAARFTLTDDPARRVAVPLGARGLGVVPLHDDECSTGDAELDLELTHVGMEWLAAVRSVAAVRSFDRRRAAPYARRLPARKRAA